MNLLPFWMNRGVSFIGLVVAIGLVSVHTLIEALAAARAPLSARSRMMAPLVTGGFLAAWLGLAMVAGDAQNFPLSNDDLLRRPLSLVVGFVPMIVALLALYRTKTMRALNEATPPEWLIRAQIYRVLGFTFLYPLLAYGVLPAGFAIPAGIGDFLTGLAAPFVASAVARRRPGSIALATAWNVFGIADLIVAPTAAVLSHSTILNLFPLALIPLFVGPPLGILTHLASLRNLRLLARREPDGVSVEAQHATA
jgi:hypothetical protein